MIDVQAYLARLAGGTPITTAQWDGRSVVLPPENLPPTSSGTGEPPAKSSPDGGWTPPDDD